MKRSFLFFQSTSASPRTLVAASTALIAATYGLVRLAYGLFLPEMQADLHVTTAVAGVISAGASVAYCLGAVSGSLGASRHARALVTAAGMSAGLGAAGVALAPNVKLFACFAVLSSAGAGLASPALVQILSRNVAPNAGTGAQSIVNAGVGPGLVVAGCLALTLLPDWTTAWLIAAIATAVAAVLVLTFDRVLSEDRASPAGLIPSSAWFTAHHRVIAAALLLGAGSAAMWNYGRVLLIDTGTAERTSVLAWVALGVGASAVIVTAHWSSNIAPQILWAFSAGMVAGASALLVVAPNTTPLRLAICAAFGWGYTAATGALIAWTAGIDSRRAPTGTAMLFVLLILGQAAGAAAAGTLIVSAGYSTAFLAAAVVCAAAALIGRRDSTDRTKHGPR